MEEKDQKIVIHWSAKKTASLICAILIVPVFVVFIFSLVLKETIISPHFYKANLSKIDAYNRLIQDGIPSLIMQNSTDSNIFSGEIISFVIQKAVDPAWLEKITNKTIDKTVEYLATVKEQGDKVEVDLSSAQGLLTKADNGLLLLGQLVPVNSSTDVNLIKKDIDTTRAKINGIKLKTIDIQSQVNQANTFLGGIQTTSHNINVYFWVSLIMLLLLIIAIMILELNNLPLMAKFISIPIILGSLFCLVIGLITSSFTPDNFALLNLNLPPEMISIIRDYIRVSTFGVLHFLEIVSSIFLGVFLLKLVVVYILEKTGFKFWGRRG